jgi:hypothetical protein
MATKSNISYNHYISKPEDKTPKPLGSFVNSNFMFKKAWEQPDTPWRCHENAFLMYREIRKKEDEFIKNDKTRKEKGLAVRTIGLMSPRLNDFRDISFTVNSQTAQVADGNKSIEWTGFFIPDETAMYQFTFTTGVPGRIWIGDAACYDFTDNNKHNGRIRLKKDDYCAVRFQYFNYTTTGNVDIAVTKIGGKLNAPPNFKTVIESDGKQFFRKLMYYGFVGSGVRGRIHFYHNNGENYRQIQDSKNSRLVINGRAVSFSSSNMTINRDEDAELIIQQTPLYKIEIVSAFFGNSRSPQLNVKQKLIDIANQNNGNIIIKSAKGEYMRLFGDPDPKIATYRSEVSRLSSTCLYPVAPRQPSIPGQPRISSQPPRPPRMPSRPTMSWWTRRFGGEARYQREMRAYNQQTGLYNKLMRDYKKLMEEHRKHVQNQRNTYIELLKSYFRNMHAYRQQEIPAHVRKINSFNACQGTIRSMNNYIQSSVSNKLTVTIKRIAVGANGNMYLNDNCQVVLDYNEAANKNSELIIPVNTFGGKCVSNSAIQILDDGRVRVNGIDWIKPLNNNERNAIPVRSWKGKKSTLEKNANFESLFSQNGKYKLEYSKVLGKLIYKYATYPAITSYTYGKNHPVIYTNIYNNITSPDQKKPPIAYYLYRAKYDEIGGEIWMKEATDSGELLLTSIKLDEPGLKNTGYTRQSGYPVPNESSYTISANVPSRDDCRTKCTESNKCGNYFYNPNSKECWTDISSKIHPTYNNYSIQGSNERWANIYTKNYKMENKYQNEIVKQMKTPLNYTIANNKLGTGSGSKVEGFSDIPERYLTTLKKRPDTNTEEGRINDLQVLMYQQNVLHSLSSIAAITFLVGAIVLARN